MHDTNDNRHVDDLTKLETELKETIEERDDVYDANNRLSDAYDELEQKVRELESSKSASESFVKVQAELVELRQTRLALESKIEQQNRETERLQSELESLSDVKENNSDLRMKIESMAEDATLIDSLRSELGETHSTIEDFRQTRLALESKIDQQNRETERLQSELETLSDLKENNSDLRMKIESMAGDAALIDSLRSEVTEANSTIVDLKAAKTVLQSENETIGGKLIDLGEVQKTNSLLANQITTLQSTAIDLNAEKARTKLLESETQQLLESGKALAEQNESLAKQVVSLSEVDQKLTVANDQISELQRENSGLKASVDDSRQKIAELQSASEQLRIDAQRLEAIANSESKLQDRLRVLESNLQSASESRDQSASELAKLQATFQVQQVRFDSEKAALVRQLEVKQEAIVEQQKISAELKSTRDQLVASQQQISDYESQLAASQNQSELLRSAEEDRAKLADQLAQVNDEQRMLRQSVIRDSARLVEQEKQIKRLKGAETSLRKTLEQEKSAISSKEIELAETKKTVRTLRAKARQQSEQLMLDLGDERKGNRKSNAAAKASSEKASPKRTPTKRTAKKSPAKSVVADDLSRIEGIGPKIKSILADNGIKTFRKLAATKVTRLEKILGEAGPNFSGHNPATWPMQAQLAADEQGDVLDRLQKKLTGGRPT